MSAREVCRCGHNALDGLIERSVTTRELPDGTTIRYTSAGRLWERPDGDLLSVNYGPWEPVETPIDFGDNSDWACPQQPDLFGSEA